MPTTAALTPSTIVVASSRQISCAVGDEAVLLSMEDGEYYGLNPVGTSIWQLLQVPRSVAAIRDALLREFADVEPAACEAEVLAFLTELAQLQLIELDHFPAAAVP